MTVTGGSEGRPLEPRQPPPPSLGEIVGKTLVVHTVTYFVAGVLAMTLLHYTRAYATTSLNLLMRPTRDPIVMAGPLFQPLRGALFGLVFYLLREPLFIRPRGELKLWAVLAGIGVLNTFGPAPGSIEGVIYTILPWRLHLHALPEAVFQSGMLAALLCYWVRRPAARWFQWLMGAAFVVVLLLPALGLLARQAG